MFNDENEKVFRVKEIEEGLELYEEQMGIPKRQVVAPPQCLSMSLEDLRKKTPEDLVEYSLELMRYAGSIDRLIGQNNAWKRWILSKLDEYTSDNIPNISGSYGFNERILMARNGPDICKKLNSFLREIEMRLSRLY